MKKNKHITINLTEQEFTVLNFIATKQERTLTDTARRLLMAKAWQDVQALSLLKDDTFHRMELKK